MTALYGLYQVFAVLFGLVLGSFWNVCIARWPLDRSVVAPRSACPSCGHAVRAHDNVPVLSWLLLRGRCRDCSWPIPPLYPLTELLGGLLGWLTFVRFVPDASALNLPSALAALLYFVFVSALCIGAFVDVRHKILPDEVTIYAIPVGIIGCAVLELLGYHGWLDLGWRGSVLGAAAGAGFFGALALAAYALTGVEALGIGDVKLLGMIGAFLGPHPAIFAVCLAASLTGSIVGGIHLVITRRRAYQPFGPMLAFWSVAYMLYADVLLGPWFPGLAAALP